MESEVAKERVVFSFCVPEGTSKSDIREVMATLRVQAMAVVDEENLIRVGHEQTENIRTENMDNGTMKECYLALGHHTEKRMSWGVKEGVVGN
tara:strand:+ start:263 stop:541 length:279 start_codon:yes stop_codon:yes gene_type:complete